jgi:hypothetical protein
MPKLTKIPEEYEAPCSPDIWTWIQRRQARVKAWNKLSEGDVMFTRAFSCTKRHEAYFRITESTVPGKNLLFGAYLNMELTSTCRRVMP